MLQNRGFIRFELAQKAVKRVIDNYNTLRPHGSCSYHPATAYRPVRRCGHVAKRTPESRIISLSCQFLPWSR